jgi:hypothetical protein
MNSKKFKTVIFVFISLMTLSSQAYEVKEPPTPYKDPQWVLLKCVSMKNGTLWASMGHLTTSDAPDKVVYFPTELVLFEKWDTEASRLVFFDYKTALEHTKILVRPKGMSLEFSMVNPAGVEQRHLLQLIQYDNLKNSYVGNWARSEADKKDVMAQVDCTVY